VHHAIAHQDLARQAFGDVRVMGDDNQRDLGLGGGVVVAGRKMSPWEQRVVEVLVGLKAGVTRAE